MTKEDSFGNLGTQTITRTFTIDTTAPSVTSINTDFIYEERRYIGTNPTDIIVEIIPYFCC